MIMRGLIASVAVALALPAGAQEGGVDARLVDECFTATPTGERSPSCLGMASNQCQDQSPQSGTTLAITSCITAETEAWDAILNAQYGQTREHLRAQRPDLAEHLLAAQRAWIAFRDADCALNYERWADGSIRGIVFANCVMVKTAERSIELRDMRSEVQ